MQVIVHGTVPVSVVVDTETHEIDRVIVEDEFFEFDDDQDVDDEAIAIAKDPDLDWPGWEFGW